MNWGKIKDCDGKCILRCLSWSRFSDHKDDLNYKQGSAYILAEEGESITKDRKLKPSLQIPKIPERTIFIKSSSWLKADSIFREPRIFLYRSQYGCFVKGLTWPCLNLCFRSTSTFCWSKREEKHTLVEMFRRFCYVTLYKKWKTIFYSASQESNGCKAKIHYPSRSLERRTGSLWDIDDERGKVVLFLR